MAEVVAVMTADAHLQQRAWSDYRDLHGDAYWGFEQLVNFAVERKAKYFIEAGDGIDVKYNGPEIVLFGRKQLRKLTKNNVQFCFVQGDHDYMEPPWFSAIDANSLHLHGKVHDLGFGYVLGWDYTKSGLTPETVAAMEEVIGGAGHRVDLAVMHQKWQELLGFEGSYDSTFQQLPVEISCLLTGDKHGHAVLSVDRDKETRKLRADLTTNHRGRLSVYSPGATCKQSILEPDTHSFFAWMSDGSIQAFPLRSRPVIKPDRLISTEARFNGLLEGLTAVFEDTAKKNKDLPAHIAKPILYVTYTTEVSDFHDRLLAAVNGAAFVFVKEQEVEELTDEVIVQRKNWDQTISQGLVGALSIVVDDEELRQKARRLLLSSDIRQELLNMKKEAGL